MCETGGLDSMYAFTASNVKFGGANACYRPLRPHLHFLRGGLSYEGPPVHPKPVWEVVPIAIHCNTLPYIATHCNTLQ